MGPRPLRVPVAVETGADLGGRAVGVSSAGLDDETLLPLQVQHALCHGVAVGADDVAVEIFGLPGPEEDRERDLYEWRFARAVVA